MQFKAIQSSEKFHSQYFITKSATFSKSSTEYDYFVESINFADTNDIILPGLQRVIENNYRYMGTAGTGATSIITLGGYASTESFKKGAKGGLRLIPQSCSAVTFIKNIDTGYDAKLTGCSSLVGGNLTTFTVSENSIFKDEDTYVGQFFPNLNCILWTSPVDSINVQVEYYFKLHQFEYMCVLQPGQFNATRNPTAYNTDGILIDNFTTPYITTIGLYGGQLGNQLLAIAKLSQPIKKSNKVPISVIIQFDYIP